MMLFAKWPASSVRRPPMMYTVYMLEQVADMAWANSDVARSSHRSRKSEMETGRYHPHSQDKIPTREKDWGVVLMEGRKQLEGVTGERKNSFLPKYTCFCEKACYLEAHSPDTSSCTDVTAAHFAPLCLAQITSRRVSIICAICLHGPFALRIIALAF